MTITQQQAIEALEMLDKHWPAQPGNVALLRQYIEHSTAQPQAVVPAPGEPRIDLNSPDVVLLWNTLRFFASETSYHGERLGGVLQGCPRGNPPMPDELASYGRNGMAALCKILGREPEEWMQGAAPPAQPSAQAERAPVVQAVQATSERTPQDYAIEHAEYMAVDGERLIAAINDFSKALQEVDDGTANPSDVDAARETLTEALGAMQSGIYEFRKRRDRASSGATPADVRMLTTDEILHALVTELHQPGGVKHTPHEIVQRKFCAVNAGKRIPADGVIGGV